MSVLLGSVVNMGCGANVGFSPKMVKGYGEKMMPHQVLHMLTSLRVYVGGRLKLIYRTPHNR